MEDQDIRQTFREARSLGPEQLPSYLVASNVLSAADVGRHLGVKGDTIIRYMYESQEPGRRYSDHPFPAPAGRLSGIPFWTLGQLPDVYTWAYSRPGHGTKAKG